MSSKKIHKILIANRGEIAVRIIRTLKRLGISSVAVFAEDDAEALHCRLADETRSLGSGTLKDTYLNIQKIIDAALDTGADAVHPGYGFLSENAAFAEACVANNLIFIGPKPEVMRLMGNKTAARRFAMEHGIPVARGVIGSVSDIESQAAALVYPVLIKAALGGGGKGMHIVRTQEGLHEALAQASREADRYFGSDEVLVEQYIEKAHHIEVQILADNFGNVIHLFERECSIQRRYQKIIEESPSPTIDENTRAAICDTAVRLCRAAKYTNAGTVEFLVDDKMNFYFLEMNTRIQVEHPVTEQRTGIDIVEEQIRIARGKEMGYVQDGITAKGHAIECRVYAEKTDNDFLPSPGRVMLYHEPQQRGVRIDSSIDRECEINGNYDPMISKLICFGQTREDAIETCRKALNNYIIQTENTNMAYLRGIVNDKDFVENNIDTHYCTRRHQAILSYISEARDKVSKEDVAALFLFHDINSRYFNKQADDASVWNTVGYWRFDMRMNIIVDNISFPVTIKKLNHSHLLCDINGMNYDVAATRSGDETMKVIINGRTETLFVSETAQNGCFVHLNGFDFVCFRDDVLSRKKYTDTTRNDDATALKSPMPGKVLKINVKENEVVKSGTTLCIVEAMKMENEIKAVGDCVVKRILVKENDKVEAKQDLIITE